MSNIFRKQGVNTGGGGDSNPNFVGTRAEWEALSSAQQNAYDTVDIVGEDGGETPIPVTATISLNNSTVSGYKIGRVVGLDISAYNVPTGVWTTVGVLGSDFKPLTQVVVVGNNGRFDDEVGRLAVLTTGEILALQNSGSAMSVATYVSYLS